MRRSIITVHVIEKRPSGLFVRQPDGQRAWLPNTEILYDHDFDPKDVRKIHEVFPVGRSLRVLVIGKAVSDRQLAVVSLAAANHDPWQHEVPRWLKAGATKTMVVTDVTPGQYYRGQIPPRVEGRIWKKDWSAAIGKQADSDFYHPRPGDRLAGIVVEANHENRLVTLSAAKLFRGNASEDSTSTEETPGLVLSPDDAFKIISDAPETSLREMVDKEAAPDDPRQGSHATPSLGRILVLDDGDGVAQSLVSYLEVQGFVADACDTFAEARECAGIIIDPETRQAEPTDDPDLQPPDVAILDVNIDKDPNAPRHGGIVFARELCRAYPRCKIILLSGEPISQPETQEKVDLARGLRISGFLFKPVDGPELLRALQRSIAQPSRDASDVFLERPRPSDKTCSTPLAHHGNGPQTVTKRFAKNIATTLEETGKELKADSMFLFSMHPVTYATRLVGQWGVPMANWSLFRDQLRSSPVGDLCAGPSDDSKGWYDSNVGHAFGKHRYLLYCYSRSKKGCAECASYSSGIACRQHRYESCAAIPVRGGPGNPNGYALFAISMKRGAFDRATVLYQLGVSAERIGGILRDAHQVRAEEANFPFLMSGRSACSLGHDLCNFLQHGIDIETALDIIVGIQDGRESPDALDRLTDVLSKARRQLNLATGTARSFRDLSRDHDEPVENLRFATILDGDRGAKRAAYPEMQAHKVELRATRCDEGAQQGSVIRARRYAMVRVFQNLLNNSSQQAGNLGILPKAIRIDTSVRERRGEQGPDKKMLCVDVHDTGPGLHWGDRHQIFEPRFTTRENGSGMGLHIVSEEVGRVGGFVEVGEAILAVGTRMRLWLPLADPQETT